MLIMVDLVVLAFAFAEEASILASQSMDAFIQAIRLACEEAFALQHLFFLDHSELQPAFYGTRLDSWLVDFADQVLHVEVHQDHLASFIAAILAYSFPCAVF